MLTTEQLGSLKQVNISVDAEKTKERTQQLWKSQKNATKNDFLAFVDCAAATVHRIYKIGSINMKLAIAFGQVLNINPYYLTGEADEPGEFTEALLLQLLEQHGYKQLVEEIAPPAPPPAPAEEVVKPKRKYTRKAKLVVEEAVPEPEPETEEEAAPEPELEQAPVVVEEHSPAPAVEIELPEEDLQALLHTLVILDRAGIAAAKEKLALVKGILVS